MYWYIKYPLIVILVLGVLGISCLLWRSCIHKTPEPTTVVEQSNNTPATQKTDEPTVPDTVVEKTNPSGNVATPKPVQPVIGVEERLLAAQQQFDHGMLEAARTIAQQVLKRPDVVEFDPTWRRAAEFIDMVNKRLMNSSAPATEKQFYRVVKGDSLARIASTHYTSIGALIRCNEGLRRDDGRDPIVRPSQTLCYIQGTWSIRVSKQHYILMLFLNGELYRIWSVGIGRENRTPIGTFVIADKLANPAWTPPGRYIPAGDPENVLGTRWLKLTPTGETDVSLEGYGIHGTTEPDTVGTSCSLGCVRLRNEEVEELFDFIPTPGGTTPPVRVIIEE